MTKHTTPERGAILRHLFKLNLIAAVALGVFAGFVVWIGASVFLYNQDKFDHQKKEHVPLPVKWHIQFRVEHFFLPIFE